MFAPVHSATAPSATAGDLAGEGQGVLAGQVTIQLAGVRKLYEQTRRSERVRDVLPSLLRPRKQQIVALDGIDLTIRRGEVVA